MTTPFEKKSNEQWVYGLHAVTALLNNRQRSIKQIFINQNRQDARMLIILKQIQQQSIPHLFLSATQMALQFSEAVHQGIVALAEPLPHYHEKDIDYLLQKKTTTPFILILDGITDPHNLGACLRSAEAAGVDFVILPKDKSAPVTAVVSKVACGAAEAIPIIRVTNLVRTMELLKQQGIWIYGAAGEAQASVYTLEGNSPLALVLGAEGEGLRRLTREHCDGLFSIPMLGTVTSLNVSVATGVCLFEIVRQRQSQQSQ
ncbi:MAG TPA: 23S rRNA (guanosine(2251)-2'-O)-methyltransferase RlmB [Legionellaceae bacterium]|nr:23S rRNA (guanosine(2251)-2'-O)-methyltransferase RlmB [Legionellaceae bacterium]